MRTPGHDEELALGFLHGEGLLAAGPAPPAGPPADLANNAVEVDAELAGGEGAVASRRFYTTSSCGVCGKGALEEVAVHAPPLPDGPVVRARAARDPARPPAPARVRGHRRPARDRALHARRRAALRPRGRRAPQRDGQGRRARAARRGAAAARPRAVRQRAALVRARPEGRGRRRAGARRRRRADLARGRPRGRPRPDAVRLRPRRARERLHAPRAGSAPRLRRPWPRRTRPSTPAPRATSPSRARSAASCCSTRAASTRA